VIIVLVTEVRLKGESEHVVVPHEEIKRLVERNEVDGIFKYGTFERDFVGEEKSIFTTKWPGTKKDRPIAHSVLTTASPDRDQDVMNMSGMILTDNYLRNPVVLPMHMHGVMPVGMTRRIKQSSKTLWAEWEWLVDQGYTMADTFMKAWDAYVLNCVSIGFLPLEIQPVKGANRGFQFDKWELVEHSAVIIPAHREAMRSDEFYESMVEAAMGSPSPILKGFWAATPKSGVQVVVKALDPTTSDSPIVTMTEEAVSFPDAISTNSEIITSSEISGGDPVSAIVTESGSESAEKAEASAAEKESDSPIVKGCIPYKETPKADKGLSWDGPSEIAKATPDDLNAMCAWRDGDQPKENKGAYKLPHHLAEGHAVVWSGVTAAMGALMGARGGLNVPEEDRRGIFSHLGKHYEDFSETSPDFKSVKEIELQDALDVMAQKNVELSERAARAEAESNKAYTVCAALSARVIQRGGVQ
jgi:hypothetical protein